MSDQEQETISDIIREKREMAAEIRAHLSIVPARREDQLMEADSLDREADRIEAAAKRDGRLMLSLMLYAVEDYVEDWAGPSYKSCVQSACKRLGIEYHSSARQLWDQIEEKIKRMEGSANEKPE